MKTYTITVNGNVYNVTVEEGQTSGAPAAAPVAAPKAAPAAAPKAAAPAASAGSVKVTAGAAGKVFKVEASVGQAVKAGDPVIILEARWKSRLLLRRTEPLQVLTLLLVMQLKLVLLWHP